ncbi:MAG: glycosyltransferase family 4 protein, partial [Oscillospiraceae bacterium]
RIMIINHYAGNDRYGMEFRPFYLGRELVKLGHEVTIIAADCSHLRKENPEIRVNFEEEFVDGIRYVFVKTVKYKRNGIKRVLNIFSFVNKLKMNSKMLYKKYRPDAIVASSTYPFDVKAAKAIARFNKDTRICYEIHDIWPLSLIGIYKMSTKNPIIRYIQRAENYAYENTDGVISILPHVNRHIEELGFHDVNYVHIPNGVVLGNETNKPAPDMIKEKMDDFHSKGKFIVMYLGGFSRANALEDLIKSAEFMQPNIQIVMVGDGPLKASYEKTVSDKKYNNVTILPSVEKDEVNATLSLADVLYIGARLTNLYKYGVGMNKLFDYMLSHRPIIYGIESSNNIIDEARCGTSIRPESAKDIAMAAKELSQTPRSVLEDMGENGYNYVVKNHDYAKL